MLPDYENMLEAIYRAALQQGDVAIDIGAHTGRHTLPMTEAVGPSGKVIAFEPLEFAIEELKQRFELNSSKSDTISSLVAHNIALGEEAGEAEFVFTPDFPEYSGFKERIYHTDSVRKKIIKVPVQRFDSFSEEIGNAVRYIKVDAEGGELTILRSGKSILKQFLPIVSFELGDSSLVHYSYTAADYYDFFAELGYTLFSIFGIPLSRDEFVEASAEQIFWDYIAIPGSEWPLGHDHIRVLVNQLANSGKSSSLLTEKISEENIARALIRKIPRRIKLIISKCLK